MQKFVSVGWRHLMVLLLVIVIGASHPAESRKRRSSGGGSVSVRGHMRRNKNGTTSYVRPHTRRRPGSGSSYGGSVDNGAFDDGGGMDMRPAGETVQPGGLTSTLPPDDSSYRFKSGPTVNSDVTANEPSWVRQQRIERELQRQAQPRRQRQSRRNVVVPNTFSGRVVGVADGDTITVLYQNTPVRVRLYGVDAPEKAQPFGTQAKTFTSKLTFGKTATIYSQGADRYGRILGWVFIGKACLNRDLVTSGLAWWYQQYSPRESTLGALQANAQGRRMGLWSAKRPVAPWEWRRARRIAG